MDKFDVHEGQKVWSVVDGAIKSNSAAGAGNLLSKEDFTNFILKAEFRADPEIHAHILLRKGRGPGKAKSGGYELQIKDKDPNQTAHGFLTASIPQVATAPVGTKILPGWNSLEITMDGTHMVVVYNGKKVVDGNDSKRRGAGAIALSLATPEDAPGENIAFRGLKVKRLP